MSEALRYQSVLQKLGQISPQDLPELDAFLNALVQKNAPGKAPSQKSGDSKTAKKNRIGHLFGAWNEWSDADFDEFMSYVAQSRANSFFSSELTANENPMAQDLTIIEGIGPKIEEVLKASGILTYHQLAETSPAQICELLNAAGSRFFIANSETWPFQAKMAAEGRFDTLQEWQFGRTKVDTVAFPAKPSR